MVHDTTKLLFLTCCLCLPVAAPPATFAQDQKEVYVAKVDPDGVQRVRLEGGGYFFKPNHIVVKVNVPVELLASREAGVVPHNLSCSGSVCCDACSGSSKGRTLLTWSRS